MTTITDKHYLGDGCFVARDAERLILTAEDGRSVTDLIVLEPETYAALVAYVAAATIAGASESKEGGDDGD